MYTKLPEDTKPEIKATTCEQYVLIRLQVAEQTVEDLTAEVDELNSKIAELKAARDSEIARFIRDKGRDVIVHQARSWTSKGESITRDGKVKTFADWASDYIDEYSIPRFMSKDEFIFVFEPELKSIYIELVDEAKEETNSD